MPGGKVPVPMNHAGGVLPCLLAPRTRLYARHVGATRCIAVRWLGPHLTLTLSAPEGAERGLLG